MTAELQEFAAGAYKANSYKLAHSLILAVQKWNESDKIETLVLADPRKITICCKSASETACKILRFR